MLFVEPRYQSIIPSPGCVRPGCNERLGLALGREEVCEHRDNNDDYEADDDAVTVFAWRVLASLHLRKIRSWSIPVGHDESWLLCNGVGE